MIEKRKYSPEFKEEAVRTVIVLRIPVSQAAQELGIDGNTLRRWIKEYEKSNKGLFPGHDRLKSEEEEIRWLQGEVARLEAEMDILKKELS